MHPNSTSATAGTQSPKDRPDFEADSFSVRTFASRNGLSYGKAYQEIAAGRLRTMKVGRRTLITKEAAVDWRTLCEQGGPRNV
ncbi:MAG: hypothetical protein ACSHXK_05775 [Oceanococcus sp.]